MLWTQLILLLSSLALGGGLVYGQAPSRATPKKARTAADYEIRTLKELAENKAEGDSLGNMAETMRVYSNILPSRVRVTYAGSTRPWPQIKKETLRQWARLYAGFPEGYTRPYETEMLFIEDGKEHWLAVRTDSLPLIKKALQRNDIVDLSLIRVGTAKSPSEWELVLLVESFQKVK
ncbi:MAG: hypothetical protein JWM21_395 [Acidobacteria bacterium]|nr:hypothetical protein [Acidobacteriota bacterium]